MTTVGLKIAIVKVLWIKGIHGISFFQQPFGLAMEDSGEKLLEAITKDITESISKITKK